MTLAIVSNSNLFFNYFKKIIIFFVLMLSFSSVHAKILSTIKPIGFIAEAMASGVTTTDILLPDGASPHAYSLSPSDLVKIKSSDLIIWVGDSLETFMPTILRSVNETKQIELMAVPEIMKLLRTGHHHEDHDHDHDHDHHHHGEYDEHIWLSPKIAKIIAQSIYDHLIVLYPNKKSILEQNLKEFLQKLSETEQNIAKKLIKVQNKGYFVFHDAYSYFETQFGLKNLGSFTVNPSIQPGVKKVYEIKKQLINNQAVCIFREPQFSPSVINKLVEGTKVKTGDLDPLGVKIPVSKDAYSQFLLGLTQQFLACLDRT